jgi:uncharacterized protein
MSGMQCPVCDVTLSISSREGIEIDFCPQCRGVWLDRGELDKIIERASVALAPTPAAEPPRREERYEDRDRYRDERQPYTEDRYRDDRGHDQQYGRKKKKRGGFLEDLFDFD